MSTTILGMSRRMLAIALFFAWLSTVTSVFLLIRHETIDPYRWHSALVDSDVSRTERLHHRNSYLMATVPSQRGTVVRPLSQLINRGGRK